jgi:2-polyprenyl-6-methoxyphenol hydroxylase-like FAD-dependent oxidoreductase
VIAKAARPAATRTVPARSFGYDTYWAGLPMRGGEMYARERRMIGAWPTNDGLVVTYVAAPIDEFHAFRSDIEGNVLRSLDEAGDLGERARAATRAERFKGTADLASHVRRPNGAGWALVGDAGLAMDPITGQGIADALRDAELLASAFDGGERFGDDERARNEAVLPMYDFTAKLAAFAPPTIEERLLFSALAERPADVERFFGALTGAVPMRELFTPRTLLRLLGPRGLATCAAG